MGLGDIVNKAKDLAADHPDQVDQGIDKAGDAVDARTGGQHVSQVDKAQEAVKDRLGGTDAVPPA
ncbi:MAG: antitoxin [Janthinobacterium lividum]